MDGATEIPAPISSSFCAPYWTQFVVKHNWPWNAVNFTVKDGEGTPRFQQKRKGGFLSKLQRNIIDVGSGKVLLSIFYNVRKRRSKAYHGDSRSDSELLFTFKRNKAFCGPSVYEAFLAGNDDSSNPDFAIHKWKKKKWRKGFTILSHGIIIAEAERTGWRMVYTVNVYPGVDQAFVVAMTLLFIVQRIRQARL